MGTNQKAKTGDKSKVNQAQGDIIEINQYNTLLQSEEIDYGIIGEIFNFLIEEKIDLQTINLEKLEGIGLKKIALNFTEENERVATELFHAVYKKRMQVEEFIEKQRQISSDEVQGIVLKLQKIFKEVKGDIVDHYTAVEKVVFFEKMAEKITPKNKKENPIYYYNALAIVLYFFEMCDFGKKHAIPVKI